MAKELTFLIVEDNDLDFEKAQRAFARLKTTNPIIRARDGCEALEVLKGSPEIEKLQKPYLVLLDVNMPRMNGFEFLEEVRKESDLSDAPVVVLTTSDREQDIATAYKHHVAGYVVKPVTRDEMVQVLSTLDSYWNLCERPTGR